MASQSAAFFYIVDIITDKKIFSSGYTPTRLLFPFGQEVFQTATHALRRTSLWHNTGDNYISVIVINIIGADLRSEAFFSAWIRLVISLWWTFMFPPNLESQSACRLNSRLNFFCRSRGGFLCDFTFRFLFVYFGLESISECLPEIKYTDTDTGNRQSALYVCTAVFPGNVARAGCAVKIHNTIMFPPWLVIIFIGDLLVGMVYWLLWIR